MRTKTDTIELDARVRQALVDENVGLRASRESRIEWRALQALMEAADLTPVAAA